jgi:hypothetical protein
VRRVGVEGEGREWKGGNLEGTAAKTGGDREKGHGGRKKKLSV